MVVLKARCLTTQAGPPCLLRPAPPDYSGRPCLLRPPPTQHGTAPFSTAQHHRTATPHSTARHSTARRWAVQHSTTPPHAAP
jgi:hypothetical protein